MKTEYKIDFPGVKLFAEGEFTPVNGPKVKITKEDLDSMVQAYEDMKDNTVPDLILTHENNKSERDSKYPAFEKLPFSLGKIVNLRRVGKFLIGDLANVYPAVKKMIEDKLITTHSAEMFQNVVLEGKKYKSLITALALLTAGKLPALLKVFEPYMYEADLHNLESDNVPFFGDIDLNNKLIFEFSGEVPQMKMKKNEYMNKMKKFMDAGCKVKDYEVYIEIEDEKEEESYMDGLEQEYQKKLEEKKKMENKKFESEISSMRSELDQELASLRSERKALQEQRIKFESELKQQYASDNESLRSEVEALKAERFRDDIRKFTHTLTRSENPKFAPADEAKIEAVLMAVATRPEAVKFSLGNEEVSKPALDVLKELLNSASEKVSFSHSPLVKSEKFEGVEIDPSEIPDGVDQDSYLFNAECRKFALSLGKHYDQLPESEMLDIQNQVLAKRMS